MGIPTLEANQSQKHVTVNAGLAKLDAIVQLSVLSRTIDTPPGSPADGSAYIVAAGSTGAWVGQDGAVAVYDGGGWTFIIPTAGWIAFVQDEDLACRFLSSWAPLPLTQTAAMLGINGTPDPYNKFLVQSEGVIFNNVGSHQRTTLNKNAQGDDAALNLQTNWSTRALVGLLGSDDFAVKVSRAGSTYFDGLVIDRDTGAVSFPSGYGGTGSSAGKMGGQMVAFSGEEGGTFKVGLLQSMGNGDTNISGAVMPFPGKVYAASMSVSGGTAGNNIASMTINKVEQLTHQVAVNYSGSGSDSGYTDYSASPLAFAAGDALNMIANTSSGAGDVVTTFFVIFD